MTTPAANTRKSVITPGCIGWAITLLFVGLLLLGLGLGYGSWQLTVNGAVTEGTVTGYDKHEDSDDKISFSPIIQYTVDGQTYTQRSSSGGSSFQEYPVGQKLSMLYDQRNPNNARINSFNSLWTVPIVLTILGGGAVLLIALSWVRGLIKRMRDKAVPSVTSP